MDREPVKVRFAFEQTDDGWPPVESEALWALPVAVGAYLPDAPEVYQIDNVPWFVRGLAVGDLVRAVPDDDGALWGHELVEHRGRLTVRLLPVPRSRFETDSDALVSVLGEVGVTCELMDLGPVWVAALDLGPEHDLATVKQLLVRGEQDGWWTFEEGCVTPEWAGL